MAWETYLSGRPVMAVGVAIPVPLMGTSVVYILWL